MRKRITHGRDINHHEFPHGEFRGYRAGCRCLPCKRAKADYNLKQKGVDVPKFRKLLGITPDHPDFPHGTRTGYKYCHCELCRKANNLYKVPLNNVWRNNNPEAKESKKALDAAYRQTAIGHANKKASHAKRRSLKKAQNTCASADMKLLNLIYLLCPEGYHVDHVMPLSKGGEHHPNNLQYLPAIINLKKRNNENFDCSSYIIRWQDLTEPSSTRAEARTAKRLEMPRILSDKDCDIVRSA
jgi:hypothetical protein